MKLAALSLVLLSSAAFVNADVWNKKTIITISEQMQIPGRLLPPGKYVLKLVESQSNRHIVQVMNEREDKVEATIIAIPNYRLQPAGESRFGFWETPAGTPKALRSWFYPGDNFGQEFAYPKTVAATLSTMTKDTVPVLNEDTNATTLAATNPTPEATTPEPAPAPPSAVTEIAKAEPAPEPTPAPVAAAAEPAPVSEPQVTAAQPTTPETLPATATPLGAIALGGLLLLSAAKSLSVYSNRK